MVYKPLEFTLSFTVDDDTKDVPHRLTSLLGRFYQPSTTITELVEHYEFCRRHDIKTLT